jgi:hypothetical protein
MIQIENVREENTPKWLKKCMECVHVYTTKNDDTEIKCRCRKGCNFKEAKRRGF